MFGWLRRRKREALTVVLHRALGKLYNKELLTSDEFEAMNKYFPNGFEFITEEEYRRRVADGTIIDIKKDLVSVKRLPFGEVDIHTHVGLHNYTW